MLLIRQVFIADRCDGLPARMRENRARGWNAVEEAERVLKAGAPDHTL